jgi:hypothetical protein
VVKLIKKSIAQQPNKIEFAKAMVVLARLFSGGVARIPTIYTKQIFLTF